MRAKNEVCLTTGSSRRRKEHFSYHFYTCMNLFIHLLGFSLIQWTIVRLNEREQVKQSLPVSLCLGGGVRLGGAFLNLGGPENTKNLVSGSPR